MTTKEIQIAVQRWLYDRSHIYQALNYGKSGYFESDVLGLTSSMRTTEIEVKISRSDFLADFKKVHKHRRLQDPTQNVNWRSPNRFYFACPDRLIKLHEVPSYAGLLYVNEECVMIVKDAPLLHKVKADEKLIIGMLNQLTQKSIYGGICKMTFDNKPKN